MKKLLCTLFVALSFASLSAEESAFKLSLAVDIPTATASVGMFALPYFIDPVPGAQPSESDLLGIDSACIVPYDATQDDISSYAAYATLILPASILLFAPRNVETWTTYAAMYGEAFVLTWGVKETLKDCVARWRPYTYAGAIPAGQESDYYASMPSGHTSLAFMSASFLTSTLLFEQVDAKWSIPLAAGSYLLATGIATLRVTSGNHFPTDVLAGAAIGSAIGWLVPVLHLRRDDSKVHPYIAAGNGVTAGVVIKGN